MFNHKIILVTGGTGSWGHELVKQLIEKYPKVKQIRIFSRNEHKQVNMKAEFKHSQKIKYIIGDIRDKNALQNAMKNVEIVFHLAALKHVPVCEENSWETVLTNIIGTQNVIESAIACKVEKVVDVSTDKAVDPFNLYGVTKACGEKLMINANFNYSHHSKVLPQFITIRGGNVLGTNGSVIPLFKNQLLTSNVITVTNLEMTRYLMSTRDAIALVFTAVENSKGSELFVMKMPAAKLENIAKIMIKLFGNKKSQIKIIGSRPGEKTHEVLVSKNEVPFTHELSTGHYVILPQNDTKNLEKKYRKFKKINLPEFTSQNTHQLTLDELERLLKKEEWLWSN